MSQTAVQALLRVGCILFAGLSLEGVRGRYTLFCLAWSMEVFFRRDYLNFIMRLFIIAGPGGWLDYDRRRRLVLIVNEFGDPGIIFCSMAVLFIFEDGLTVTWRFGKLDISANVHGQNLSLRPGTVCAACGIEELLDVSFDLVGQRRPAVEYAKQYAIYLQLWINSPAHKFDRLQ